MRSNCRAHSRMGWKCLARPHALLLGGRVDTSFLPSRYELSPALCLAYTPRGIARAVRDRLRRNGSFVFRLEGLPPRHRGALAQELPRGVLHPLDEAQLLGGVCDCSLLGFCPGRSHRHHRRTDTTSMSTAQGIILGCEWRQTLGCPLGRSNHHLKSCTLPVGVTIKPCGIYRWSVLRLIGW